MGYRGQMIHTLVPLAERPNSHLDPVRKDQLRIIG